MSSSPRLPVLSRVLGDAASAAGGKSTYLGMGTSFFDIEQGESQVAAVDHFDTIANLNTDEVRARLSELHLNLPNKTSQESSKFYDPDGFQLQVNRPDYIGHVS
jgi:hypothetical protein